MMTTTNTATKRTATKSVEISTWAHKGRCETVAADVSDAPVRVRQDGYDTAVRAYGRRMARAAGGGLHLITASSQGRDEGARVYQLTFGYSSRAGGSDVAGTCWIKVYG
jgi:hypothetical protein